MEKFSSIEDLDVFYNRVSYYLYMEYDYRYYEKVKNKFKTIVELIKSYYWGGNNIPETARAIVDLINRGI